MQPPFHFVFPERPRAPERIAMNFSRLAFAFVAISLGFVSPDLPAQQGPLDGRAFVADAGEKGKPADEKGDVITFAGGKFHSSACDQFGYGKGAYRASAAAGVVTFEAETTSEKDGRLAWKGTVKDDAIEGTFIHYRKGWFLNPNPEPVEHWFKGQAKR
jgi:hypothetical protein